MDFDPEQFNGGSALMPVYAKLLLDNGAVTVADRVNQTNEKCLDMSTMLSQEAKCLIKYTRSLRMDTGKVTGTVILGEGEKGVALDNSSLSSMIGICKYMESMGNGPKLFSQAVQSLDMDGIRRMVMTPLRNYMREPLNHFNFDTLKIITFQEGTRALKVEDESALGNAWFNWEITSARKKLTCVKLPEPLFYLIYYLFAAVVGVNIKDVGDDGTLTSIMTIMSVYSETMRATIGSGYLPEHLKDAAGIVRHFFERILSFSIVSLNKAGPSVYFEREMGVAYLEKGITDGLLGKYYKDACMHEKVRALENGLEAMELAMGGREHQ